MTRQQWHSCREIETRHRSGNQRHPKHRTSGSAQSQLGADEKEATGDKEESADPVSRQSGRLLLTEVYQAHAPS